MTIYVILPVHNRVEMTRQFLTSLDHQSDSDRVHVLLIDDGSTDGTSLEFKDRPDTTIITGDGSLWWAGSVERALEVVRLRISEGDFLYLANNDTVLSPDHLARLLQTARDCPDLVIGSVSYENWPGDIRHPVSAAFAIDPSRLEVSNLTGNVTELQSADALAGRGTLIPAAALPHLHMNPKLRPQHFADLAMTRALRKSGFDLVVQPLATSTQLARAGSSVEIQPSIRDVLNRRSQLYLPGMWSFWWEVSSPRQRLTLPFRFLLRAVRQIGKGAYSLRQADH
jgi:GT2 family glycosyltransferase